MKKSWIAVAGILFLASAGAAFGQTLSELAKKEKERRENVAAESKPITNDDASKYKAGPVTTGSKPSTPSPEEEKTGEAKPVEEPVDFEGRPESFWRQTFSDARQRVGELENEANVLTLKLNDLQNQFYREDSGFRQQEIQREIQKTFYLQDLNKEKLGKAKEQLLDLEKEARRSGALPGWIESRRP